MTIALLFDTETTGKWDFKADFDAEHQPHLVQLAYRLIELETGKVFQTHSTLIQPAYFDEIEDGAQAVHGISIEDCRRFGVHPDSALVDFSFALTASDVVMAHNFAFDSKIIDRTHVMAVSQPLFGKDYPHYCTMHNTTQMCQLPKARGYGYKWPKLVELHIHLFGKPFEGAHDALVDVLAMERCVLELFNRGLIPWKKSA